MKKQLFKILSTCIIVTALLAGGCGNSNDNFSDGNASSDASGAVSEDISYDADMDEFNAASPGTENAMPNEFKTETATEAGGSASDSASDSASNSASLEGIQTDTAAQKDHKLIYTYNYSVETKKFDSFMESIVSKTAQLGGYVESSETTGSSSDESNRSAYVTLRIPANQMSALISMLDSESNVTYRRTNTEDVTLQYVDMKSHVEALRTEQKTLLRLIDKAENIEDVITLQSQLTEVRYEIESYESKLRIYDNMVDYSTMYLDISEVDRTTTVASAKTGFFDELQSKFSDNLYAVGQGLRTFIIWLISSLPVLILLAAIVLIFIILYRKWKKHSKKHSQNEQSHYQNIYTVTSETEVAEQQPANEQDTDHPQ